MRQLTRYNGRIDARLAEPYDSGRSWIQPSLLMPKNRADGLETEPGREPFITIDDLKRRAQELAEGLSRLAEYRHPLGVRCGKEVIEAMGESEKSKQIRAGGRTYFFDIEKTSEGKAYLRITESRYRGEGSKRERNTINVFPEDAAEFASTVSEMIAKLS